MIYQWFLLHRTSDNDSEEEWVPESKAAKKSKRVTAEKMVTIKKKIKSELGSPATKKPPVKKSARKTAVKTTRKKTAEKPNVDQVIMVRNLLMSHLTKILVVVMH